MSRLSHQKIKAHLGGFLHSSHLLVVGLLDGRVHLFQARVLLILDDQLRLVLLAHLDHGFVVGLVELIQGSLLILLQDHDVVLELV